MLTYWLYRSKAMIKPRSQADGLIYLQANKLNPPMGLTGYLHRDASTYVQYVEGPVDSLKDLQRRVKADGRHYDVETLMLGLTPQRRFAAWDMAFTNEEIVSFNQFQKLWNLSTDLASASGQELLTFMKTTAESGLADLPEKILARSVG